MEEKYIAEHYTNYDENGRLITRTGSVEYITTMKYIHNALKPGMRILEVGAGTGRYSLSLSREGYDVTAVELVEHNISVFKSRLAETDSVKIMQGNILDLSFLDSEEFDLTLILGPMYHLYTEEDKIRALREAKRVTKPNGLIMAAYCMNEAVIMTYGFKGDGSNILNCLKKNMITSSFHCISKPEDIFEMVRLEDIDRLNAAVGLKRQKIIATDLFTHYMPQAIEGWSEEVFQIYLKYHLTVCERPDLIGISHHTLDILTKEHI